MYSSLYRIPDMGVRVTNIRARNSAAHSGQQLHSNCYHYVVSVTYATVYVPIRGTQQVAIVLV
jgi:hypothetical protein